MFGKISYFSPCDSSYQASSEQWRKIEMVLSVLDLSTTSGTLALPPIPDSWSGSTAIIPAEPPGTPKQKTPISQPASSSGLSWACMPNMDDWDSSDSDGEKGENGEPPKPRDAVASARVVEVDIVDTPALGSKKSGAGVARSIQEWSCEHDAIFTAILETAPLPHGNKGVKKAAVKAKNDESAATPHKKKKKGGLPM